MARQVPVCGDDTRGGGSSLCDYTAPPTVLWVTLNRDGETRFGQKGPNTKRDTLES